MSVADYEPDEEEVRPSSALASFGRFLRPYLQSHRLSLAGVGLALLVDSIFDAAFPLTLKFLIDGALVPHNLRMLLLILAILAAVGLLWSLISVSYEWVHARVAATILRDLRQRLFDHLQTLSLSFYTQARTGKLLACFSGDMVAVESAVTTVLPWGIFPLLQVIANIVLLFVLNWQLAVVATLVWPLAMLWPRWFSSRAVAAGWQKKNEEASLLSLVQENLVAQPVVKAFDLRRLVGGWFVRRNEQLRQSTFRVNFLSMMVEQSAGIATLALHWCVLSAGAYLTYHSQMTIGTLVAFEAIFLTLSYSITDAMQFMPSLVQAVGGIRRINELFAEQPTINDAPNAEEMPRLTGGIAFQAVSFSYTGLQRQLHDIDLCIPQGAYVAFVGPSGAGKSTLANLMLRLYDPTEGAVLVDGRDLRGVRQDSWRRQVAVVFQENVLLNISLRENIRLGRPGASDAEVEAAARAAEIHDFIKGLPQGYETPVGERGGQLSGGQRQRIAIARALIRNPAVLILDEATSGLDLATEAAIARTLTEAARGRTVITITHRLSSVTNADLIFVLEAGCVAKRGTHTELLEHDGPYARLWHAQLVGESSTNLAKT